MSPQFKVNSNWSQYYLVDIESLAYLKDKEEAIHSWMANLNPNSVLDLGANTGKFSFIASLYSVKVIALDYDPQSVEYITKKIADLSIQNIYPLVGNVAEPSPTIGYSNSETHCMPQRLKCHVVLCLALFHHLFITNKLSFNQIFYTLNEYCHEYLVIEYIPVEDPKFKIISENSKTNILNYNLINFKNELRTYFVIINEKQLSDSGRILFLSKKINA